jgi:hypothetical protein
VFQDPGDHEIADLKHRNSGRANVEESGTVDCSEGSGPVSLTAILQVQATGSARAQTRLPRIPNRREYPCTQCRLVRT